MSTRPLEGRTGAKKRSAGNGFRLKGPRAFCGIAIALSVAFVRLLVAPAWTVPAAVAIDDNERLARWLQPVVQRSTSALPTALATPVSRFSLSTSPGSAATPRE